MATQRWTEARAWAWWKACGWVCGCNFIPSSAVNFIDMWHPDSFDRVTIERELGWAARIGMNAIRTNLPYLVWLHDRDGLLERLDWLMTVADRLGLATVPCLFDDCGFGGFEPEYGTQPDPVPGVHNSRAVASPGRAALLEASNWPRFETYVRDVIATFATDRRVLFWDLYNEPGNRMVFGPERSEIHEPDFSAASQALMRDCFEWARDVGPNHPLTVAAWVTPPPGSPAAPYCNEMDRQALALSDIITFHAYWDTSHVELFAGHLARLNRPMLCTEWMARPVGSRIADQLCLFRKRRIGCFQWGLVRGRTQTHLPWPPDLVAAHGGDADHDVWFHDIFERDGRPYDRDEIAIIMAETARTGLSGPDHD